jgi:hypothetical protein
MCVLIKVKLKSKLSNEFDLKLRPKGTTFVLYNLQTHVSGCGYDVRINDCPVFRHKKRPVSGCVPVNEWVIPGINTLSIVLRPPTGEHRISNDATIEVIVEDSNESTREESVLAKVTVSGGAFQESESSPEIVVVKEQEDQLILTCRFAVPSDFPDPVWLTSQPIPESKDWYDLLTEQYQTLWNALSARDFGAVIDMSTERNKERSAAYGDDISDEMQRQQASYEEAFDIEGMHLASLAADELKVDVFGNGRLVQLVDGYGQDCIQLMNDNGPFIAQFQFIFRNDGPPVICR